MTKETTYERLMREAKEEFDRQMMEGRKMKVREVLDHMGLKK